DREAGRRHRLAAEARHQPVVTPAAADRAEAHRAALLVLDLEGQFHLLDRAGVVLEPADDGCIHTDTIHPVSALSTELRDLFQFIETGLIDFGIREVLPSICDIA